LAIRHRKPPQPNYMMEGTRFSCGAMLADVGAHAVLRRRAGGSS